MLGHCLVESSSVIGNWFLLVVARVGLEACGTVGPLKQDYSSILWIIFQRDSNGARHRLPCVRRINRSLNVRVN